MDGAEEAEARSAAKSEEPKTETTLTTRIRINIPGSRPIPPVVMRTPVGEEGATGGSGEEERTGGTARPEEAPPGGTAAPAGPSAPAAAAEPREPEKASDWFSPRKQTRATPAAPETTQQFPAPPLGGSGPESTQQFPAPLLDGSGPESTQQFPAPTVPQPDLRSDLPYFTDSDPTPTGPTAITPELHADDPASVTGQHPLGGFPGGNTTTGTGEMPVPPVPGPAGPLGGAPAGLGEGPAFGDQPGLGDPLGFGTQSGFADQPAFGDQSGFGGQPGFGDQSGFGTPSAFGDQSGLGQSGFGDQSGFGAGPGGQPGLGDPQPGLGGLPGGPDAHPATPPHGSPLAGGLGAADGAGSGPFGGRGAETPEMGGRTVGANLFRDPEPAPGGVPAGQASGDTLVSGIPAVPPTEKRKPPQPAGQGKAKAKVKAKQGGGKQPEAPFPTFQDDPSALDALNQSAGKPPAPPAAAAPAAAPAKPAKKKGRSKLALLGVGLVAAVGVAYAAGLVMNHADVPNGTTVLGVDIGGSSKEEAVRKLDAKLGKRAEAPIKVTVDGEQHELKPSVAGLSLDTEGTVRDVSGRDYNPVNVIGSLFGGTRTAGDPVVVDEEKLSDALERLAGESGSAREGTIEFVPGKAKAVYGKPGKGLDVAKAVAAVSEAYRTRAETGQDKPVTLPVVTKQPKIGKAEVDRAMREFAEPAMSGLIKVRAGGKSIDFGPAVSLPRILSMTVVDGGKLQEHYDLDKVKELYGNTFDGVLVQRGNGSKTPVTPQDVVVALRSVILEKDPAKRIAEIPLDPS
ncbi:hypothetical protein ACZ90_56780 [Streptomyces albus subsp. albus]|nr:hypothetical protein ACZ90_56780 [Streptomyces albus subsp. albus]